MTLINCSECNGTLSDKASACPHCGAPTPGHVNAPRRPPRKKQNGCAVAAAILASCLGGVFVLALVFGESSTPESKQKRDAVVRCRMATERQLRSPSSAELGPIRTEFYRDPIGGGRYSVTGWVDSQNAFGAVLRSRYACSVVIEDGVWRTPEVEFFEK